MRLNDLMLKLGDCVQLMATRMDPRTGEFRPNPTLEFSRLKPQDRGDKTAGEIAPTIGLEGFACGNWTRLGNRKSVGMGLGNVQGDLASWNDRMICTGSGDRKILALRRDKIGPAGAKLASDAGLWGHELPAGYQATAIIVCPQAVVVGGGAYDSEAGGGKGFVRVLAAEGGKTLAESALPAPLSYNGLALAGGRLYATLADGSAVCLGAKNAP